MQAVAHNPAFAKKVGIAQSVGRDFAAADAKGYAEGGAVDDDSWLWDANNSADDLDMAGGGRVEKPKTVKIAGTEHAAEPLPPAMDAASNYMKFVGRPGEHLLSDYPEFNEDRARKIGQAYEEMRHDPSDPRVKRSYDAMIEETLGQLKHLKGYDFQFLKPGESDPYAQSPAMGYLDLRDRGRMHVFPTDAGFGTLGDLDVSQNPLLKRVGPVGDLPNGTANDAFRIVHDMFGHHGPGNPFFRHKGEERAWLNHSNMYSPEALPAMTSETRGQNSWLNFGPYGERNRNASGADTIYADQKTGLLPDWAMEKAGGGRVRHVEFVDNLDRAFGDQSQSAGSLVRQHTEKTGKEGASFGNEFFHTPLIRGQRTSVDLNGGPRAFTDFADQMEQQHLPYFSVHAHPLVSAGGHDLNMQEAARVMSSPKSVLGGGLWPSSADMLHTKPNHTMMIESAGLPDNRLALLPGQPEDLAQGKGWLSKWYDAPTLQHQLAGGRLADFNRSNGLWAGDDFPLSLLINDRLAYHGVPLQLDSRTASGTLGDNQRHLASDVLPDFRSYMDKHDLMPYARGGHV